VTPRGARVIRGGLLVVLVGVSGMVALSLRRPGRKPAAVASPSPSPVLEAAKEGTRLGGFVHRTVKTDKDGSVRESVVVRAQSYEGKDQEDQRLKGVEVSLTYTASGKPGHATITADTGIYAPILQRAVFQGNVHVKTDDGMELWTEELIHRGDRNTVRSDKATRFLRKDLSGTATGFTYESETGRLELLKDVDLKIQDEDNPATLIKSARAEATREDGLLKFLGGVDVTQGNDRLKSQRLVVNFAAEDRVIHRAQALDDVELWTSGATQVPGMTTATAGSGSRYLKCRRLDLWFRPDRTLQQAVAGPNADLTMMPGPRDPPEKKRLRSDVLDFVFDDKGRLESLTALKDTTFTTEAIPPSKAAPRALECKRFVARIDPLTGQATTIEFVKDVAFSRGAQHATAQRALYEGSRKTLSLAEDPVVIDEQQGTELRAEDIDMAAEVGDVHAREAVRHILRGRSAVRAGLLGSKEDPTLITAGQFDYTAGDKVAAYKHDVLLRSGKDEIRSGALTIRERPDGKRRLEARDRVMSRMQPKAAAGAGAAPAVLEARAGEMTYDEAANVIDYKGDVFIRQGDIQTKSPAATLSLNPDGGSIKTLEAGEPVEVQQAARRAKGTKGTYTPSTETMVLVGDNVMLTDATGQVQGRSLTFHVGDERVLVDGREEVRTQMIIKQEPR
jgi:lipopolysaccharide transport protein LptA/LPS export ABC transporter protein LptC